MPTASCRLWLPLAGTCALVACGEPDPTLLRINPATVELSVGEAPVQPALPPLLEPLDPVE